MQQIQENYLNYILLAFFACWGILPNAIGQCTYPTEVRIVDNDTSNITFVIRGASNNDLSSNGICGVNLKFTHDYVGDVSIYLVSPSGQEVQLVGPSVESSSLTQFVNWDVTFIPCSFPAAPDPGLFARWNNLGNWFQFNTYDGTYYPSNNCLEDLNIGPVNGNWTLRVEDAVDFGSGNIESASLIFCDDTGIQCETCVANAGQFTQTSYSECEGKEELRFYPEITYSGPAPPDNFYNYLFVILDVNGYVDLQDTVDLNGLNPATYQICGLSIEDSEINNLNITFGMDKGDIEDFIFNRGLCADLSDQCITFVVQDVIDTIFINETLCTGEVYDFNGEIYDSTGTYQLGYSPGTCESVSILNLDYFNIQATIEAIGSPQLTCTNDRIRLDGSSSFADGPLFYQWSTDNGYIRTPDTLSSIMVTHTGNYYLEVVSGNCVSRDTFTVFGDGSNPELRISFDTVSCIDRSTFVLLTTKGNYASARWNGPTFSRSGDNITASISGEYYLTITNNNGCNIFDTINIIGDLDVEEPIFNTPDISCFNEIIQPNMTFADGEGLSFNWTGPGNFVSTLQNPNIDTAGFYRVSIMAENGCTEQHSIAINDVRQYPAIATSISDTLTCNNRSVNLGATSTLTNVTYSWRGPGGFTSSDQNPQVNTSGNYIVTVTTTEQCAILDTIMVNQDVRPPLINASDIAISCTDGGSVPLSIMTTDQIDSYSWTGPAGYSATGQNPQASVIGSYRVMATGRNGCISNANFNIVPDSDIPNIAFTSDTIHCDNRSISINPSLTASLNFLYTFPDGSTNNNSNPSVNESGLYAIRVSEGPCVADYLHRVLVDTVYPAISFDVEEIDCDADSVTLNYISSLPLRSGLWEGPSMFSSDITSPFVDFPATFIFAGEAYNGCTTIDSVDVRENFNLPQLNPRSLNFTCVVNETNLRVTSTIPPIAYQWSGPNGFTSQLARPTTMTAGTYYMTVTGDNGCINSDSLLIGYDTIAPIVDLTVDTMLTCDDPEVTLTAAINETMISTEWEGPTRNIQGGNTQDIVEEGLWKIVVTDNTGCIGTDSVLVESAILYPTIGISNTIITCFEPQTLIEITIDQLVDSVLWNPSLGIPDNQISVSTAQGGTYSFNAIAINGCDSIYSFEVLTDTIPNAFNLSFSDTITCNTPAVILSPNPDAQLETFEWFKGTQLISQGRTIEVTEGGDYVFRSAGLNGCYSSNAIFLPVDTIRPIVETFPDTITCRNPRLVLDFTTNISDPSILWTSDFGYSSENLRSRTDTNGIYTISVTGNNGCPGIATLEIIADNQPPKIILDTITYLLCDSTAVSLGLETMDINLNYQWFFDENTFLGDMQNPIADSVGRYTVYVNGENGCGISKSTEAVVDTRLPEFTTFTDLITCQKETVTIGANFVTDDIVWQWIGPNGFVSSDTFFQTSLPGQYFLSVDRSNRCRGTMTVIVPVDTISPNVIIDQNQEIQCEVRIIDLDGRNSNSLHGASYFWTTDDGVILSGMNNPLVTIRDPGNYQLKIIDNFNGCADSMNIIVTETEQQFMDFTIDVNNPFCAGYQNGEILVSNFDGGDGPYKISLDGDFFAEKEGLKFLSPGTYMVSVQDSFGCIISKEAIVEEPRPIFINLGRDTLIRFGDSVTIFGTATIPSSDIAFIEWSPPAGLSCTDCLIPVASPSRTTRFRATIYDENGCEASNEIIIRVDEEPDIAIPTIFRPSSNNGNEIFYLPQIRGVIQVNNFSIYDRWGNRMYHAENFLPGDKQNGWDGRFQGQQVQPAVFTVITNLNLINGENVTIVSDVTLIR